jgi:hypothetical protein
MLVLCLTREHLQAALAATSTTSAQPLHMYHGFAGSPLIMKKAIMNTLRAWMPIQPPNSFIIHLQQQQQQQQQVQESVQLGYSKLCILKMLHA